MSTSTYIFIAYIAGVISPIAVLAAFVGWQAYSDRRHADKCEEIRRMALLEYDSMTPEEKAEFSKTRLPEDGRYESDRDLYAGRRYCAYWNNFE